MRLIPILLVPLLLTGCADFFGSDSKPIAVAWYDADEDEQQTDSAADTDEPEEEGQASVEKPAPPKEKDSDKYGIGVSLDGFRPFPDDDPWNQQVTKHDVDPRSDQILAYIGLHGHLHPDFGSGKWDGSNIGIPYIVVPGDQPKVTVTYEAYGDQSDPGPFPLPFNTPVEGDPYDRGDRHAIVVDRDNGKLYELFRAFPRNGGASWVADSGAIFDLKTNTERPEGWTSADAAGLPIFPGLVRYDEVGLQKEIRHAIRFTLDTTRKAYVAPASHWASRHEHPLLPPLGMRVRLKPDVDLSSFPPQAKVILQCLKTYGMILADNGSDWFISGSPDERWDNDDLRALRRIKIDDLEVLKMDRIVTPYSQ